MKLRPMGAEFFHADGQTEGHTDRHDETNGLFSQLANALKNSSSQTSCKFVVILNWPHIIEVSQTVKTVIFNSYIIHCTKLLN